MNVLVFEHPFRLTGHRLPYAVTICEGLASEGHRVTLAIPSQLKSADDFESCVEQSCSHSIHFYDAKEASKPAKLAKEVTQKLLQCIDDLRPDRVVLPSGDLLGFSLASRSLLLRKFPSIPIDILLLRGEFVHRHNSFGERIRKRLKWQTSLMGKWNRTCVLDPIVYQKMVSAYPQLELCPDPVPPRPQLTKQDARGQLGLPPDRSIILSIGNQNAIKGVDLLIDAFQHSDLGMNAQLVLAGPASEEVSRLACRINASGDQHSVDSVNRFLTESEFQLYLASADIVAVPYRKTDRPSGVISRCICWGIPIVGSQHGWPRWAIETFAAGMHMNPLDRSQFAIALRNALTESSNFTISDNAKQFAQFNTIVNYQRFWANGLANESHDRIGYTEFSPPATRKERQRT